MPEHTLRQLSLHSWWMSPYAATDQPTLGVGGGGAGSLVVDAGASPEHARTLLAAMEQHGLPPQPECRLAPSYGVCGGAGVWLAGAGCWSLRCPSTESSTCTPRKRP